MGEKFSTNPSVGTASLSIPIATSKGRKGPAGEPSLALSYNSGSGNGVFGLGWSLGLGAISRKTDRGLPRYWLDGTSDEDVFILSGAEDLVPTADRGSDGTWTRSDPVHRLVDGVQYAVHSYLPRTEGLFASVEKWTAMKDGTSHWRVINGQNVTSLYGEDEKSRIFDPEEPRKIFSWLLSSVRDDRGNIYVVKYRREDSTGVDLGQPCEANRTDKGRAVNLYPKSIQYGNQTSTLIDGPRSAHDFMFEVVFDYGEHHHDNPLPADEGDWICRHDPFSTRRPGFELRTYRLCQRILMFHHFPDERGVGANCLVKSYDLVYRSSRGDKIDASHGNPVATLLASVQTKSYRREGSGYAQADLPPLEMQYANAVISEDVQELDSESETLKNLPAGIDGVIAELVDLDGEGLPGVLTQLENAWYYKPPLGHGHFGPMCQVPLKPSLARESGHGSNELLVDLDADGMLEVVYLDRRIAGYSSRVWADGVAGWTTHENIAKLPNLDWADPNIRFIDLTGNGLPDILISQDTVFSWYPSLMKEGYGNVQYSGKAFDEEEGPTLVFSDASHSIFTADMSGDGLPDLVRINRTEVCYWPNLGYGLFGAKIAMSSSPILDRFEDWDPRRLRLGDVDGTGTADIIYLGTSSALLHANAAGNGFSEPQIVQGINAPDNVASVRVADILGNGTNCLIWSSSFSSGRQKVRYLDLTSGVKPHILTAVVNNMGSETRITYKASTKFYLEDKLDGMKWVSRLPFPIQVVERVDTVDRVGRTLHTCKYAYHHGHFDAFERELIGFGLVEQWDTDEFAAMRDSQALQQQEPSQNLNQDSHVPPVYTKTWFHLGIWNDEASVSRIYEDEYWKEPGTFTAEQQAAMSIGDSSMPTGIHLQDDKVIPHDLSPQEMREASRALRGYMLRREIYGLDGSRAESRPYIVSEANFSVTLLQPLVHGVRNAVFFSQQKESIDIQYERVVVGDGDDLIADPRTSHNIILDSNYWGNVRKSVSIAYGRRVTSAIDLVSPEDIENQTKTSITFEEFEFTNAVIEPDVRRIPNQCENRQYELVHVVADRHQPSITGLFGVDEIHSKISTASDGLHDLAFEDIDASGAREGSPYRRLLEHARLYFRKNDLSEPLPLKQIQSMALPYQTQQIVYTPELLKREFVDTGKATQAELQKMVVDEARYIHSEGDMNWWTYSGLSFYSPRSKDSASQELEYAKSRFFQIHRYRDQFYTDSFKTESAITYDKYDLLVIEMVDALGNTETVGIRDIDASKPLVESGMDYRVLAPVLQMDANRNIQATAYDIRGLVAGIAAKGKPGEDIGDELSGAFVTDLSQGDIDAYLADPLTHGPSLLGSASTRVVYDPFVYQRTSTSGNPQPCVTAAMAREIHHHDLAPGQITPVQHHFNYHDGQGRVMQAKSQAEPGPVPKRDPQNGTIVISNGNVVMATEAVAPRWVASGWTVTNNKGLPVRQFEPFFTDRITFEFDIRVGPSSIFMYDPLGRTVATLSADHTWRKAKISPWREENWDSNDTISVADPTKDSDLGGQFSRLESDSYTPSWYEARKDGQLGQEEQLAAQNALIHADTPTVSHLDALGRRFIGITHNKFKTGEMGPSDTIKEEFYGSKTVFDAQGNIINLIDASNRTAGTSRYNMMKMPIFQKTMDGGDQCCLDDVAGRSIYLWNNRGIRFRHTYDELQRNARVFVKKQNAAETCLEVAVYGETIVKPEISNVRGRPIRFSDAAGVTKSELYDFKGNLLRREQVLVKEYKDEVDWNTDAVLEQSETFLSSSTFNALNQPVTVIGPDKSVIRPTFDKANRFRTISINIKGTDVKTPLVTNIEYDAKGQRTAINYANNVRSSFVFDNRSNRLSSLVTTRNAQAFPDDSSQPAVSDWPGSQIQNLHYTYDPVGNVTNIRDDAQQRLFFNNKRIDPSVSYIYDAAYRILQASGREYLGLTNGARNPPTPPDPSNLFHSRLNHKGDGNALGRYTERYVYDAVNNIAFMKHIGTDPANPGWTQEYKYVDNSNRLSSTSIGNNLSVYGYSGNGGLSGCMTEAPHLSLLEWNSKNQMSRSSRQKVENGGTPETTYYTYDTAGQRIRKVTEWQTPAGQTPARKNETIYIGNFEIFRQYDRRGDNVVEERETLRVQYSGQSVAQIETKTKTVETGPVRMIRFQHGNMIGSVSLELDDHAEVISYEEYSPFGSTMYQGVRNQKEVPKRYRYAGKERDEESGFYYCGARYYMPWLGRWTSADPAGFVDGLNVYAYVMNNPVSLKDPSGMQGQRGEEVSGTYSYPFTGDEGPEELQEKLHRIGLHYEGTANAEIMHSNPNDKDSPQVGMWHVEHLYKWSQEGGKGSEIPQETPAESGGDQGESAPEPASTPESTAPSEEDRNWWSRGGSHVFWGSVGLGILAAVYFLSNPVGWFSLLAITMGAAAGFASVGAGSAELVASYSGQTTAKQDEEMNEAISTTSLLAGSPGSLVGGTAGMMYGHDEKSLRYGAMAGALTEAAVPLALKAGPLLSREIRFGFPSDMSFSAVKPLLHEAYDIGEAAARRRPNPLFFRSTEYIDLSHVVPHSSIRGTAWQYLFHRPFFIKPMWATEHGLLDPQRYQFMTRAWKGVYESQQISGAARWYQLLPTDTQLTVIELGKTTAAAGRAGHAN